MDITTLCDLCQSAIEVETECLDCEETLCKNCSVAHQRSKATKHHQVVRKDISGQPRQKTSNKTFCDQHSKEEVNLFCKTCDILVCTDCIVRIHKQHDFVKIKDIVQEVKKEVSILMEKINSSILPELSSQAKEVDMKLNKNKTHMDKLTKIITSRKQGLMVQLNEIEAALSQENEEVAKQNSLKLENIQENLKVKNELIKKLSETDFDHIQDTEIIKFRSKLKSNMAQIYPIDCNIDINLLEFVVGEAEGNMKNMFGYTRSEYEQSSDFEPLESTLLTDVNILANFEHGSDNIRGLCPIRSGSCWVHRQRAHENELVDINGKELDTLRLDFSVTGFACLSDGSVILTSHHNKSIYRLSPDYKLLEKIKSTEPFYPGALCVLQSDIIAVTVKDNQGMEFTPNSKRGIIKLTTGGEIIKVIEYDEDGSRLFTYPRSVSENPVTRNICVVDRTSNKTGRLCILDTDDHIKFEYCGRDDLTADLQRVVCDRHGYFITSDYRNDLIHFLNSKAEFLSYLTTKNECIYRPHEIEVDKTGNIWVGCDKGNIYVIKYLK